MKNIINSSVIFVVILSVSACSSIQKSAASKASAFATTSARATETVEQLFIAMEQSWVDALPKADISAISNVLADDFVGIAWNGDSFGKKE